MTQALDVLGQPVGIEGFDLVDDPGVERSTPVVGEARVGDLVRQGVVDRVHDLGQRARLVQELAGLKARESAPEHVLGEVGNGLEEGQRYVLADDRGGLQQMLLRQR